MNSKFMKRFLCLFLSMVMLVGMVPTAVLAAGTATIASGDSSAPVGMTVSVGSSLVTIDVNRVGTTGTATLYRVAAGEYMKGDSITGLSQQIVSSGNIVGEYTCGSTQQFIINRYLSDGSDNLYDKYYLVQNSKILVGPVYASNIYSIRDKKPFETASKKGLTLEDETTINVAKEMGATNTVINWNLAEMIVATEDANGNPRDLSRRTDLIEFESNGKTYYFKRDYIKFQDGLISAYSKAGMNVTLVIIAWVKTLTADYPRSLMYFDQTDRQTLAFNTSNERGMEYWIAAMEFMADRYSKSANMGLIDKYIIGNEIDYTYDWYLIQPLYDSKGIPQRADFDVFMEEFARTLRLANCAIKKYNASAKAVVSLTHNWAESCYESYGSGRGNVRYNSYAPKDIVDWLVKYEGARGDFDWGLAVHPYAVGTNPSNPLKTDVAGTYGKPVTGDPDTSPWITVANLELYQLYLQRPENKYRGEELRTVSLTETTVLSMKSGASGYTTSINEQAASIAQTYYRAANIPCIDQIAYFQLHDQTTTTYMVGLITAAGVKKPAYDVWKYIDTNKSFLYSNKYLKYISSTAKSYQELMPAVKSSFDWNTMWDEDNMIFRTVEGGDSVRELTTNKTSYNADEQILVTAKGDVGDTVELYKSTDNIATAEPLYSYPVVGSQNGVNFFSGSTYDLVAYGEIGMSRLKDAVLKAGNYQVVLRRADNGETIVKPIVIKNSYYMGETAYSLMTDKDAYTSGENIIVSATGNTKCWVGLYKKGDVYGSGNVTSIFWYYINDSSAGQISGKPTILQRGIHNNDSSNPSTILAPGEYVLYLFDGSGGNDYNAVMSVNLTVTEAQIDPLTSVEYKLEDNTDGFANGTVTVTKDTGNINAVDCIMFWADAEGKPLEGYTGLAKFKLTGKRTVYQMPSHTIIPVEAKMLLAFASDGNTLSKTAVSVKLPENCGYSFNEKPLAEFQVVSDIHITTDEGARNEVKYSNLHFNMMLEDVIVNSPESIGIFVSGDNANTGSAAEYKKLLSLFYAAKKKGTLPDLHIAIGNHDWISGNPGGQFQYYAAMLNSNLKKQPQNVYYDEVVNGYNFIYLAGEEAGLRAVISKEQLDWFDQRMAEITAEDPDKPVFVLLHQSFYNTVAGSLPGQGWDGVANEDALSRVMEKYGQIILLNGHSHWELNSDSNMYAGDSAHPVAFNTASVSYLWTSYDVMGGEHLDGTHGYFVRVYKDKVVFLGRDFENQKFVPSAAYVIRRNTISGVEDAYDISIYESSVALNASALDGGTIHYASSDNNIASVTDDGIIIAKKPGTVNITITTESTNTAVIAKKTIQVHINDKKVEYTVTFKNWDGTVLSEKTYLQGDTVIVPADPTRAADDTYTYTFAGWDKPVVACNGNAVYTAQFKKSEINKPTEPKPEVQGVTRVFGEDRYQTAFKAADTLKAQLGISKFQNIIVSSGTDFADALAGSYLAAQKGAPILLIRNRTTEMDAVKDYIKANLAPGGTVYLLGGVNAVPQAMETGLDGFSVKRLGGADRYDTNLLILKEAGVGDKDIIVCTGKNFADSLSASATGLPILLVKDSLYASQKEFLATTSGKKIIVGGNNAVNLAIENQLKVYGEMIRLAGSTRYDTSVLVAQEFFNAPTSAVLAYAQNFPDGLSGGPLAHALKAPLILTDSNKPTAAVNYSTGCGIKSGYVMGGSSLISDKVVKNIFAMSADSAILVK